MRLDDLISGLPIRVIEGTEGVDIADVTDDSRLIQPGWLFIARKGTIDDGARFIEDAKARGAAAVVSADATAMAQLAERAYGEPSQKLKLVGVTGTNGKTTVAYIVRHLLNSAGPQCGMMSTVEIDTGDTKPRPATLTTPGACEISRLLAEMVAHGCTHAVMECSSHALDQGRCDALAFDVAVFTNLTGDHLDYHQTMEAYAAAKAKLFALLRDQGVGVVNMDDAYGRRFAGELANRTMGFAIGGPREGVLWNAQVLDASADGSRIRLEGFDDASVELQLPLLGEHNIYNLLAAVGVANLSSISFKALRQSIERLHGVPGRLERVSKTDAPFTVLVDYAHTDDAIQNVLQALRPLVPQGASLRVLLGCGGDRDRTKRPRMAQVACGFGDQVIITSDNPRTEDPQAIINDIVAGVPEAQRDRVTTVIDRKAAIESIIRAAQPGDIVLLAGKGHEDYQIIGSTRHPFDDRVEARRVLAELKQGQIHPGRTA